MKAMFLAVVALCISSVEARAACRTEDHLRVFRNYYGALEDVSDFEGRVVPDTISQTSTLLLTYTYQLGSVPERYVAYVVLDNACQELAHGTVPVTPLSVF